MVARNLCGSAVAVVGPVSRAPTRVRRWAEPPQSREGRGRECTSCTLSVITLAPDLEKLLESSRAGAETDHITLDPTLANSMIESLRTEAEKIQDTGTAATLVVSPGLRSWMSRFVRVRVPDLTVLSYTEIPDDQRIQVQSSIGGETAIEGETE